MPIPSSAVNVICEPAGGTSAPGHRQHVAAGILPAVVGGILPPGDGLESSRVKAMRRAVPPGRMPGSTAGKMPAATALEGGTVEMLRAEQAKPKSCKDDMIVNQCVSALGCNSQQPGRTERRRDWEFNPVAGGNERDRLAGFHVHHALNPETEIGQVNGRLGLGCLVIDDEDVAK